MYTLYVMYSVHLSQILIPHSKKFQQPMLSSGILPKLISTRATHAIQAIQLGLAPIVYPPG